MFTPWDGQRFTHVNSGSTESDSINIYPHGKISKLDFLVKKLFLHVVL